MRIAASVDRPRVVIIGGGEAGLECADSLEEAPVDITLIDRNPYQTDKTDIWKVAVGRKHLSEMTESFHEEIEGDNVTFQVGSVESIDAQNKNVGLADGREVEYDYLVVALGSKPNYFGHQDWASRVLEADGVDDPLRIRGRIQDSARAALSEIDPARRRELLNFVIVGGGATGVELAGVAHLLVKQVDPSLLEEAKITLVSAGEELLGGFPPHVRREAEATLRHQNVQLKLGRRVVALEEGAVRLDNGELLPAAETLWGAGTQVNPLLGELGPTTASGRLIVDEYLRVPGHESVFVVGDASLATSRGLPVPANEDSAEQEGEHAARNIKRDLRGRAPLPFLFEPDDDWEHFGPVMVDGSRTIRRRT